MIERIEVNQRDLVRLVAAMRAEEDGQQLDRDLVQGLERAARPALMAAKADLMAMESHSTVTPGLRQSVASHTNIVVRLVGSHPGVSIVADKRGMPRGFRNAPKRLNDPKWRHKVYGDPEVWVTQVGRPGWFDSTIPRFKPAAARAAQEALDNVADRIDSKTKG